MNYYFYGHDVALYKDIEGYSSLHTVRDLYDALTQLWCAETCAPRMRDRWTKDNKTLGQCSITAFLVQDLLGGDVYGIRCKDGNYHCYNVVDGCTFDLTSEQFGDEVLSYVDQPLQSRDTHFGKEEKYQRYLMLKKALFDLCHDK